MGGAGKDHDPIRTEHGSVIEFFPFRRLLIELDIAADGRRLFQGGADDLQAFQVHSGLGEDAVERLQQGREEEAEPAVTAEGFVRDPGIDQRQPDAPFLCHQDQIGPQFGLHDHDGGRLQQVQGPQHREGEVNGAENDFHVVRRFVPGDFLSRGGSGAENIFPVRIDRIPLFEQGQCQIGLTHADGMDPDCALPVFQFFFPFFGEDTEPFPICFFPTTSANQFNDQSGDKEEKSDREEQSVKKEHKRSPVRG